MNESLKKGEKMPLVLFAADTLPAKKDAELIMLAEKVMAGNTSVHLYAPLPLPPGSEYRHLNIFPKIFTELKKALLDNRYEAVVFFSGDSKQYYRQVIKGLAPETEIIGPPEEGKVDADDILKRIFKKFPEEKKQKLVSIVMLTFNQMALTKQCLESMEQNTEYPHELIIVDNGSTDGTVEFIKNYKAGNIKRIQRVFNSENLAFSKANNQGIQKASGDYILLLNNDVILTKEWLTGLVRCLESSAATGAVGPCTNEAAGPQKINPGYEDLKDLSKFTEGFKLKNAGRRVDCHRLTAFCLLIKREVIKNVGLLDERFGPGGFEDYDYCLRIMQAGYNIVLAGDVYVHHVGGQGYEPNRLNYGDLRKGNKKIFIDKWCRRALEVMETLPNG